MESNGKLPALSQSARRRKPTEPVVSLLLQPHHSQTPGQGLSPEESVADKSARRVKELWLHVYILSGVLAVVALCLELYEPKRNNADDAESPSSLSIKYLGRAADMMNSSVTFVTVHMALAFSTVVRRLPRRSPIYCLTFAMRVCLAVMGVSCALRISWLLYA